MLVTGVATRRSIKRRPAGATPPTLSCNCRLARPVPLLCTLHLEIAPGTWFTPLHAGMKRPHEGRFGLVNRDKSTKLWFNHRCTISPRRFRGRTDDVIE